MAASSLSGSWVSSLPKQLYMPNSPSISRSNAIPTSTVKAHSKEMHLNEKGFIGRRSALSGIGALTASIFSGSFALAEEIPENFKAFVDFPDGYTYYYPSDWRDFDFRGHDSAFKDRTLPLQNVRVSFKPTDKSDIRDLGPMDEVIFSLVKNIFAAPTQRPTIFDIQERTTNGKNYWTFEYELASPNFSRSAFATIAIGNGRYYTLIVGANERRWSRLRKKLKVVADSFKLLDI
ncbi:photosynthetic NDH subunit of lumenal location 1, chloroplastic [Magnolia sinica]|uniref:photosynthetic NDH subunit of lumenal location 1, chloroplastic n=1 Tax=Magnolia sinica TaxID=86752 RepID=UPI002658EC07|nr:photosynthetic NDH subunit of lumenal location 1, chloroplastic [Magnolia sinica]